MSLVWSMKLRPLGADEKTWSKSAETANKEKSGFVKYMAIYAQKIRQVNPGELVISPRQTEKEGRKCGGNHGQWRECIADN